MKARNLRTATGSLKMGSRFGLGLLLLAALVVATRPAVAQPGPAARPVPPTKPTPPGDPAAAPVARPTPRPRPARPTPWAVGVSAVRRATALRHFKAGNHFFERSQYAKALAEYRKAIPQWDHPAIRYNMAVCLINVDRYLEAHHSLTRALRYGARPLGPQLHAQALTSRKLLLGRLARIRVACSEPDAQVSVDGTPAQRCDAMKPRWVLPGKHVVVAKKSGFLTATLSPILLGGRITKVRVKLMRVEAAFQMKRRWARWMPWTLLGAGAAVALSALPLLLTARADIKEYDSSIASLCADRGCEPGTVPSSVQNIEKRAKAENASGFVLLGLGGAAVAAGIVFVILNQPRAIRSGQPQDQPTVSIVPTGPGFAATFRF